MSVALGAGPGRAAGQVDAGLGLLLAPDPGPDGAQIGPAVNVGVTSRALGIPLRLGAVVGRVDFNSLGQDYHNAYYLLGVTSERFLVRGRARLGLRAGFGAAGEYQTAETDPPSRGGDNWAEAAIAGVVLELSRPGGGRMVLDVSDTMLGPYFAIFDPSEYGLEHRWVLTVGFRF